jgi:nucleoid-associated protein YgaU
MNRDAKIGVVVILIIVGLLVIIWGRSESTSPTTDTAGVEAPDKEDSSLAGTTVDTSLSGETSTGGETAGLGPGGAHVVPPAELPLPPGVPTEDEVVVETPLQPEPEPAPETVAEPEPGAAEPWTYTVAKGDILSEIAQKELGSAQRWREIADLNDLSKPYHIFPKQKLKMPPRNAGTSADTAAAETAGGAASSEPEVTQIRKYVVRKGDMGIMQIAKEQCGDVRYWKKIVELNNLKKPFMVTPGEELLLPK